MNCPKCGKRLPDDSEFCQYCGSKLADASVSAGNAAPASAPELAGKTCPFCKAPFLEGEAVVFCSHCEMPHHLECWKENGGCTTFGCTGNIGKIIGAEQRNAQSAPVATRRPAAPAAPRAVPYPQTKHPAGSKPANERISRADELARTEKQAQYTVVEEETCRILQGNVPVVLETTKLLKDKEGRLFLSCHFVPLTDKSVSAMLVDVLCADVWRVNLQPVKDFQYLDLLTKRDVPFGENILIPIPDSNTRVVNVVVQKLMLADGTLVTHTEECVQIPDGKPLTQVLDGELIEEYRRITSNQAQYIPAAFTQAWVCTCGAVNRRDEEKCHVCGGVLNHLLEALNAEKLRENREIAKKAQIEEEKRKRALEAAARAEREREKQQRIERENRIRQQHEKEAEERDRIAKDRAEKAAAEAAEKKKRLRKTAAVAALAVVVLMTGGWAVLRSVRQPSQKPAETPPTETLPIETPVISPAEEIHEEEAPVELTREERIYLEAEQLAAEGKIYEAATTFYTIKDYKDSWDRCFSLWGKITCRKTIVHWFGINENRTVYRDYSYDSVTRLGRQLSQWGNLAAFEEGTSVESEYFGLMTDGTVVTVGPNGTPDFDVSDWADIVSISLEGGYVIGIKADGSVVSAFKTFGAGKDYGQCDVSEWKDIVMVAAGGYHTVGLKADGTVVVTGKNTVGQCNVESWADIVAVAADKNNTIGLKTDGTVVAVGDNSKNQCSGVKGWTNIVAVDISTGTAFGLTAEGTVISTRPTIDICPWNDIVQINGKALTGLRRNGDLVGLFILNRGNGPDEMYTIGSGFYVPQ